MNQNINATSVAAVKEALAKALDPAELSKAWTQSNSATTGLTQYNLEGPAKLLVPVITPLRNMIPRVVTTGGIQANWKAITGFNTTLASGGVSEGNRGRNLTTTVADYNAAFRGWGHEDSVTFEAQWAAEGYDDARARASDGLLKSVMITEEKLLLGGLGTWALGQGATPTVSTATSGGSIAGSTAVYVRAVPLSLAGYYYAKANSQVLGQYTATNADGTTDTMNGGAGRASASGTVTTGSSGSAHTVSASTTAARGAVGYAWFAGTTDAAASLFFAGVTTINSIKLTELPSSGGQALPSDLASNDRSQDSYVFDGMLSIAMKSGTNAYYKAVATGTAGTGTPLTSDTAGGIVEIDDMLQSMWDNYRIGPDAIWVSSQEALALGKKVLTGGTSAAQRFTFAAQQGQLVASRVIKGYLNPFSMDGAQEIPIRQHPNLPPGTILATTSALNIPYSLTGVTDVFRVLLRRDYYQIDWPKRTRKDEFGIYADGVLQHYFPPSMGVITNIARD